MAIATSTALGLASIAISVAGAATSITMGSISAANQKKAAGRQMQAMQERDKAIANNRKKQIKKIAAQQRSSFLTSGISLTGDGTTEAVQSDTYSTGIADIKAIAKQGGLQGEALQSKLRANLMSTYGTMASDTMGYMSDISGAMGSLSSMGKTTNSTYGGVTDLSAGAENLMMEGLPEGDFSSFGGGSYQMGDLTKSRKKLNPMYGGFKL